MNAPRLTSGFSHRLLSVLSARQWLCRNVATENRQVTLGQPVGGRVVTGSQVSQLDAFLGRWLLEKMPNYKSPQTSQKAAMKLLSKVDASPRTSLMFQKNGGMWMFQMGDLDTDNIMCYHFYLGQPFIMIYPNGKLMQTVIFPEGEFIKWQQQNLDVPGDMMMGIAEVRGQKLIWKTKFPDGTKLMKKYARK